jgi:hypothetical protein
LVEKINKKTPNAIKDITEKAITVVTEKGRVFNIPLQDTIHDTLTPVSMPSSYRDAIAKYPRLRDHPRVSGYQVDAYYQAIGQKHPTEQALQSVVNLMPSGTMQEYIQLM